MYHIDEEAIELFKKYKYSLILTDIVMEGITGLQVLEEAKKYCPDTPVILISGYVTIETTIEGLRNGASDYILNPCKDDGAYTDLHKRFN